MKELKLTKGQVAFVDDEDYDVVNLVCWQACPKSNGKGFCAVHKSGNNPTIFLHRLIMLTPVGLEVDHIDHNSLNCQKYNMRNCLPKQNKLNRRKFSTTQTSLFKGVYWDATISMWRAYITVDGKTTQLGTFKFEKLAALTYNKAALLKHGEFASLNDIKDPLFEKTFNELLGD